MNHYHQNLKWKERLSYSGGTLGSNFLSACINTYLLVYYTNFIHISPGIAGSIMLVSKILDAVSDIIIGLLIEKMGKPGAKARPWIRCMCFPFILISISLFCVPSFSAPAGQILYIFVTYNAFCTIYTALNIPYRALNGLITENRKERELLSLLCSIFTTVSSMIVNSFTLAFVQKAGDTRYSWTLVVSIYAVISGLSYYICYKNTTERIIAPAVSPQRASVSSRLRILRHDLSCVFRNKYWRLLAVNSFFSSMTISLNGGSMYYFLTDVCHEPRSIPVVGMILSVPMLFLVPLSKLWVNRWGLRNSLSAGYILLILGRIITGTGSAFGTLPIYLGSFLFAVGCSTQWCITPLLLHSVDYGEKIFGIRQDGMLLSSSSFFGKCGAAFGTAICGWILALTNYRHHALFQPPTVLHGIQVLYVYLPILFSAVSFVILLFYNMDSCRKAD